MKPERWQQIDKLLEQALEQEPNRRKLFLDGVCGSDDELRREVETLLLAHEQGGSLLSSPALTVATQERMDPLQSLIGQRLSHYQILSRLGEGGMGIVYKARDQHLDRFVAIKVLPRELVADPDRKRRFVQEAKAASALNHSNIITIHDIASDNGIDLMVMEFVQGKTLGQLIPRQGMRLNDGLNYAIQVADALAKAHAAGIVHRDLKPGNVMVGESGQVKVLDFGLAKLLQRKRSETEGDAQAESSGGPKTQSGVILGTASYMSPEQAEGKAVDHRSDIFSFGALLYEMITGRRAFQGDTGLATLTAILREEPKPASDFAPGLPAGLDHLIAWCLRKDPKRRIQHMDDVKVVLEDVKLEHETAADTKSLPPSRKRRWKLLSFASVTILAVLALWFYLVGRSAEPVFSVVPLTSYPGLERFPTFSPDGNQVAFVWSREGWYNGHVYVQWVGNASPRRLTEDPAPEASPAWSPDGRWIAYVRIEEDGYSIWQISPLGDSKVELAKVSLFGVSRPTVPPLGLSWSPDSKWLAFPEKPAPQEPFSLFAVSLETRQRKRLTFPPGNWHGDFSPAFSPDGRTIAFSRRQNSNLGQLYLQSLTPALEPAGELRQLTFEDWLNTAPAWTPDGRQIVYSAGPRHGLSLWRIDIGPSAPHHPLSFSGSIGAGGGQPALSREKHRLVFSQLRWDVNIWRIGVTGEDATSEAVPLIASTLLDHTPSFSSDGTRIAFASYRSGTPEIWVCDASGQNLVQLTYFNGPEVGLPQWSPDGSRIVFEGLVKGQGVLFEVGANGGTPRRLADQPGNNSTPTWSRDGRWIYLCSDRSGRREIWKMPAEGGQAKQVTRSGGRMALESWDGQWLYVLQKDYGSLWRQRIEDGKEEQILDSVQAVNFAVGSKGLYFIPGRGGQEENTIELLDPKTGKRRTLAVIHKQVQYGFAVSPDERWILYPQGDQEMSADLMLVENFR